MTSAATIRPATRADVAAIVDLLADDPLGQSRENPDDLAPYLSAFDRIVADAANLLVVAETGNRVVGVLQLTIIPGLARSGATRSIIEGVRVAASERGLAWGHGSSSGPSPRRGTRACR